MLPTTAPVAVVGSALRRLDPLTLEKLEPLVRLPEYHRAWSVSPDGSQIALGMGSPSRPTCGAGLCIVDLASMRVVGDIDAPIAAEAVGWVSPERIAAVLQGGDVMVFDPVAGATISQHSLSANTSRAPSAMRAGTFVALLAGFTRGRVTLVAVDETGNVRTTGLSRVRIGGEPPMLSSAGLTLDRSGQRAFVFAPGAPAAEVDLQTMRVRYYDVEGGSSSARTDTDPRCAVPLGGDRIALDGVGVQVINTKTWKTTTLSAHATRAHAAAGRLLVYRSRFAEPQRTGVGLRIYSPAGRLVAHQFGSQTLDVQIWGRFAYVLERDKVQIVDARSGEIVHRGPLATSAFLDLLDGRAGDGHCA